MDMLSKLRKDSETYVSQLSKGRDDTASDAVDLYKSKQEFVEKLATFRTDLENLENYNGEKKKTEQLLRNEIKKLQKDIRSISKKIRCAKRTSFGVALKINLYQSEDSQQKKTTVGRDSESLEDNLQKQKQENINMLRKIMWKHTEGLGEEGRIDLEHNIQYAARESVVIECKIIDLEEQLQNANKFLAEAMQKPAEKFDAKDKKKNQGSKNIRIDTSRRNIENELAESQNKHKALLRQLQENNSELVWYKRMLKEEEEEKLADHEHAMFLKGHVDRLWKEKGKLLNIIHQIESSMTNLVEEFPNSEEYDTILFKRNVRKNELINDLKKQYKQKAEKHTKEEMFAKEKAKYTKKIDKLLENLRNLSKQKSELISRKETEVSDLKKKLAEAEYKANMKETQLIQTHKGSESTNRGAEVKNDEENIKYKYEAALLKIMKLSHEKVPERSSLIAEELDRSLEIKNAKSIKVNKKHAGKKETPRKPTRNKSVAATGNCMPVSNNEAKSTSNFSDPLNTKDPRDDNKIDKEKCGKMNTSDNCSRDEDELGTARKKTFATLKVGWGKEEKQNLVSDDQSKDEKSSNYSETSMKENSTLKTSTDSEPNQKLQNAGEDSFVAKDKSLVEKPKEKQTIEGTTTRQRIKACLNDVKSRTENPLTDCPAQKQKVVISGNFQKAITQTDPMEKGTSTNLKDEISSELTLVKKRLIRCKCNVTAVNKDLKLTLIEKLEELRHGVEEYGKELSCYPGSNDERRKESSGVQSKDLSPSKETMLGKSTQEAKSNENEHSSLRNNEFAIPLITVTFIDANNQEYNVPTGAWVKKIKKKKKAAWKKSKRSKKPAKEESMSRSLPTKQEADKTLSSESRGAIENPKQQNRLTDFRSKIFEVNTLTKILGYRKEEFVQLLHEATKELELRTSEIQQFEDFLKEKLQQIEFLDNQLKEEYKRAENCKSKKKSSSKELMAEKSRIRNAVTSLVKNKTDLKVIIDDLAKRIEGYENENKQHDEITHVSKFVRVLYEYFTDGPNNCQEVEETIRTACARGAEIARNCHPGEEYGRATPLQSNATSSVVILLNDLPVILDDVGSAYTDVGDDDDNGTCVVDEESEELCLSKDPLNVTKKTLKN